MSNQPHNPRPVAFVSPISDTDVKDKKNKKDHNPIHQAAHYLKNAVTLESKSDEKRRESAIADPAHVNDHGGKAAEAEFWDKHGKGGMGREHVSATDESVGHITNKKEVGGPVTGTLL
ncbi:hypothetical protein HBI75_124580 [Parastagonospora nodorum]|nr:hypothetical protein HBI75_124580 [Parastagonospora nodorum]